jgi:biotin synthesis protein BioG
MSGEWLVRGAGSDLIVCCNGWGMDRYPFSGLAPGPFDIFLVSDYSHLHLSASLLELLPGYRRRILIGWSMGVWAAQRLFVEHAAWFQRRIAINGTLRPIDDRYGIPREVFAGTLRDFSAPVLERFYRRMCKEPGAFSFFDQHRPQRDLADQHAELAALRDLVADPAAEEPFFSDVIVSANDLIIPTAHQLAFWGSRPGINVVSLPGCHYPFFRWQSWVDIVKLVTDDD